MSDSGTPDDEADEPTESGTADESTESDPADDSATSGPTDDRPGSSGRAAREVVVPLRVYKTVVVFSTLIAVALVVGGFAVLDVATRRARLPLSDVDPVLALAGLAMLVAGALVYAFSTRFRARGMGKPKDEGDESSNNG